MARNIGKVNSYIDMNPDVRKEYYKISHSYPIHNFIDKSIKVHKNETPESVEYFTNDHDKKETLHRNEISKNIKNDIIPFDHHENRIVERQSDSNLPKGHAENITYNHFLDNNVPLRSSDTQTPAGNHLWKKLTKRSLLDGHYVYYFDGNSLHNTTHDNLDKHLDSYFNADRRSKDADTYEHRHMILSKTKLK
jgi:hypothetical protein